VATEEFVRNAMESTTEEPDSSAEAPLSGWQKFRMVVKVIELRLRFIALMAITGFVFGNWDTIRNYYEKWDRPAVERIAAEDVQYFCPMHPNVIRDQPGNCPICGMPLSKRKLGAREVLPDGVVSRVSLAPFRVAQAGVRTVEVEFSPLVETLETVGRVDYDERRRAIVASKIKGMSRVEKLFVNFEGMDIEAKQPLAELYAPELDQAMEELLLVHRSTREKGSGTSAIAKTILGEPTERLRLATEKLVRWGITKEQVDKILRNGRSNARVSIQAPIGGHVTRLNVREGQYVSEGDVLFEVADLQRVWVVAQVHEDQLALVRENEDVEATVRAFPGETFRGKVTFVQPHVDASTRTVDVRFDLENPQHRLRPGMYAKVSIKAPVADLPAFQAQRARVRADYDLTKGDQTVDAQRICPVSTLKLGQMGPPILVELSDRKVWTCCKDCPDKLKTSPAKFLARITPPPIDRVLSIPEEAVIDTGSRRLVYVEAEPGIFEGREVVLGPRAGNRYPVLEGLLPNERIAAAGAFLIDAETRLNPAAGALYFGGTGTPGSRPAQDSRMHSDSGPSGVH
jgi:membrane fusion protein, copper/silver efflux system